MPRHDLDVISLIAGVAAAGSGAVWLVNRATGMSGNWIWPVLLILVGVVGLLASRRSASRDHNAQP